MNWTPIVAIAVAILSLLGSFLGAWAAFAFRAGKIVQRVDQQDSRLNKLEPEVELHRDVLVEHGWVKPQ